MNSHAGWRGDITPGMVAAALVIIFGIPAAAVLALIGVGTWLGAIVWF